MFRQILVSLFIISCLLKTALPAYAATQINGATIQNNTISPVKLTAEALNTDTFTEGVTNLFFSQSRVLDSILSGFTASPSSTVTSSDTIATAINKLQAQIDTLSSEAGGITSLTGDVTATGPGASAATIANDVVTYGKIQNVSASDKVLGRTTSGAGDIEEISTTGSGNVVRATSPVLVTPTLGAATATTVNGYVPGGTITYNTTTITIASSNAETSLLTATVQIPSADFIVGRVLKYKLWGRLNSTLGSGQGNITINVKLGSSVISTSTLIASASVSNRQISLDGEMQVMSIGAGGTIFGQHRIEYATSAGGAYGQHEGISTAPVTVDTTSQKQLNITWTWSVSSATNSVTWYIAEAHWQ